MIMANNHFYRDMMSLLVTKICQQNQDGRSKETMAELGLTDDEIKLFCSLNQLQIEQLSKSRIQLFSIEVNTESLAFVRCELEKIKLIERCVSLGAPNDFLNDFFGLTSRDACSKRILSDIDAKRIKRVASIEQADLIIDAYLSISSDGISLFGAKEYCDLFDKLKADRNECSFKAIWLAVSEYLFGFDREKIKHTHTKIIKNTQSESKQEGVK
jgi:hypothetical protein